MAFSISHQKLELLNRFFETYGTARLRGLDESYFVGLNESEKEKAWNFLEKDFSLSDESISALYILDRTRAIELFKKLLVYLFVPPNTLLGEKRSSEIVC